MVIAANVAIPMKKDRLDDFVFLQSSQTGTGFSTKPAGHEWWANSVKAISRAVGWTCRIILLSLSKNLFQTISSCADRTTLYVWRRFPANVLNVPSVTEADRKNLMGHVALLPSMYVIVYLYPFFFFLSVAICYVLTN